MGESPYWMTTIVTTYPRTGLMKEGSRRVFRSDTPPPPTEENWPRPQRFRGPLTRVDVFESEAGETWAVQPGVQEVPRELADHLVETNKARLAPESPAPR